ncbi:porin family protein [Fulvivirga sedimenti]|uniref:PorT family protein n=1 Tax=Fulvivirga sedimenti TaxID=2879465 RepID=A0A9X1HYH0_9BACT|nr:porin family protein [Fulvivirga sedimenti]MCA6078892.1 PorT family protein [Fulvivirga sedimenti]
MCCSRIFFGIIFTLLMGIGCRLAEAQILVGPKVGVQYGWIGLDNDVDKSFLNTSPAIGMHAGGVAIFRVRERFYLHTELLYEFRQQVITGELDELLRSNTTAHYIQLPISFKINFKSSISNLKYQWFAGAGPNLNYWIGGSTKLESSELDEIDQSPSRYKIAFKAIPDENTDPEKLYIEDANRMQLGVNAVGGLMFEPQTGTAFIVDIRFDYGHSFFARKDYGYFPGLLDYSEPTRARYMAIKLGLTYVFDTKVSESRKGKSTVKDRKRK